jgi:hypothetical protein
VTSDKSRDYTIYLCEGARPYKLTFRDIENSSENIYCIDALSQILSTYHSLNLGNCFGCVRRLRKVLLHQLSITLYAIGRQMFP